MINYYKRLILLILVIGGISGAVIYYTGDIHTFRYLRSFQPWSVLLALGCLALGMYFDGTRLVKLSRMAGERISLPQSIQVILSNYFLALLTPGAAGGAVAQVLFLRHFGLSTGRATVIVMVRTILSVLFLMLCLPLVVVTDTALLPWFPPNMVGLTAITLAAVCLGGVWFVRTHTMKRLVLIIVRHLPHRIRRRAWKVHHDVQASVEMLASSPVGMVKVFADTGLSLLALYSIVPALFSGMGVSIEWSTILGRMIFLNLLLYFAPTPGGSGIAEGGFIFLFSDFVPPGTVGLLAVAWRVLTEYLPFVLGLYFTIKAFGSN
jgi:uncharacterized protein (TIRG00374 family)